MRATIELWPPSGEPLAVPLDGDRVTLGKGGGCSVVIDWDRGVSRVHAVLERFGDTWVARDLGSRNGTFVNGERLAGERLLRSRDEIRLGATRVVFHGGVAAEPTATAAVEPAPEVTRREREVLVELCRPMLGGDVFREPATARRIAETLVVSEDAVKQHLRNLYRKFLIHEGEERRRVRLANEAIRRGAIGPADLR